MKFPALPFAMCEKIYEFFVFCPDYQMIEAAGFYEERAAGLGADFLDEVERVVQSIAERPDMGRQLGTNTLRRITRRFPFGVLYKWVRVGVYS